MHSLLFTDKFLDIGGCLRLTDLNSANGTLVNRAQILLGFSGHCGLLGCDHFHSNLLGEFRFECCKRGRSLH